MEIKQLKKELADSKVQFSKYNKSNRPGTSDGPKRPIADPVPVQGTSKEDRVALYGRKFGVMNEIFVSPAYFLVENPHRNPYSSDRYKNSYSTGQGVIAELFSEVPKDLHRAMTKHTGFRDDVWCFYFNIFEQP